MQFPKVRGLSLFENIRRIGHNIRYRAQGWLDEQRMDQVVGQSQIVYLLGKTYVSGKDDNKEVKREVQDHFKSVIWITYRSGFPELLKNTNFKGDSITDAGWGCIVRVGQMVFAEFLKTYLKPKKKQDYVEICEYFNDFRQDALFSIHRIAKVAKQEFDLLPGQWYNASKITYILSNFLNQASDSRLSNLKSIYFKNSTLFFDQVIKMFEPNYIQACDHKDQQTLICEHCNISKNEVSLIIITRLGLDTPDPKKLEILNVFMSMKWFRGLIGGRGQRALYFIGRKKQQYVYLDPHYVQAANEDISSISESYFCNSWRQCKNSSICPSVGISFYFQSLRDLNEFHLAMRQLKEEKLEQFFIFMADETPQYAKEQNLQNLDKMEMESCEFEQI